MRFVAGCFAALLLATPALAQPGLGEKVYGATLEPGVTELEARYGRVTGDDAGGADALTLEGAHHFSDRIYGAVLVETGRERDTSRKLEAIAVEGIYRVARITPLGIDVALYGEYGFERHGADTAETKLLLQRRAGSFDGRLNLIAEKRLESHEKVEFGYSTSADWSVVGEMRAGAAAFGSFDSKEHYVGPILKTEIEHLPARGELGIEAGYLFSVGSGRREAPGQIRLLLEYEFHL
ncbi:hypothetical protein [Sphingomonas sp.]|uniref:hypothetical protein n=1 Tax=Sphingomonas sp. TaxID=28214 RepID=UPI0025F3E5A2|nr:hypothetical protein [Sphingomonas sp.]